MNRDLGRTVAIRWNRPRSCQTGGKAYGEPQIIREGEAGPYLRGLKPVLGGRDCSAEALLHPKAPRIRARTSALRLMDCWNFTTWNWSRAGQRVWQRDLRG